MPVVVGAASAATAFEHCGNTRGPGINIRYIEKIAAESRLPK
jgi:hypothetical protein